MKKIKVCLSGLLSMLFAVLCFALVGCTGKAGEFISGSADSYFYVYSSLEQISVNYSFEVSAPSSVNYEIEYTVNVYHGSTRLDTKEETKTITPTEEKTRTVSGYYDFSYNTAGIDEDKLKVTITDVTVTPKESSDEYQSYAIGFGTAGGAAFIACTVLFIVLKEREKK